MNHVIHINSSAISTTSSARLATTGSCKGCTSLHARHHGQLYPLIGLESIYTTSSIELSRPFHVSLFSRREWDGGNRRAALTSLYIATVQKRSVEEALWSYLVNAVYGATWSCKCLLEGHSGYIGFLSGFVFVYNQVPLMPFDSYSVIVGQCREELPRTSLNQLTSLNHFNISPDHRDQFENKLTDEMSR